MADQATLAAAPDAAPAKKGKKKLLLMVVMVLVVAAAAYWFLVGSKASSKAGAPEKPVMVAGKVLALDPIYVNLSQGHFLKLSLALQETTTATKETDGSKALDAAITIFSGQDMATLSNSTSRAEFKKELVNAVVEAYDGEVMDIYFTEFVMQ